MSNVKRVLDVGRHKVSKGITQAATLGHANLIPFKFRFELKGISVENLRIKKAKVILVWERREKQVTSEEAIVQNGRVTFKNDIHFDCTLFRGPDAEAFQEKKAKLAVRIGGKDGKTVAKVHLNFAEYAKVPSGSDRVAIKLSDNSTLKCLCNSTLAKSGRSKTTSQGGSSAAFSVFTTGSGGLSKAGDFDDLADLDDLNDLDLDGDGLDLVPTATAASTVTADSMTPRSAQQGYPAKTLSSPRSPTHTSSSFDVNGLIDVNELRAPATLATANQAHGGDQKKPLLGKFGQKLAFGRAIGIGQRADAKAPTEAASLEVQRKVTLLSEEQARLTQVSTKTAIDIANLKAELSALEAEILSRKKARARNQEVGTALSDSLEKLKHQLRRANDRNADLEAETERGTEQLAILKAENERRAAEEGEVQAMISDITNANRQLRSDLERETRKLDRAVHEEALVNELKSVKLQLALSSMEKDEAVQMLRAGRNGIMH